jgi:hypothetical protein
MDQGIQQQFKLMLDEEQVKRAIRKNQATSYGLTFVAGLPFPPDSSSRVEVIQRQIDDLAPGRFAWYDRDHMHVTVVAPLRGRYRDHPILQRAELPADLQRFAAGLADFFAKCHPFFFELNGVNLTPDGTVVVNVSSDDTSVRQLAALLRRYPALDQPKYTGGLHVSIGYINTVRLFATDAERSRLEDVLSQLSNASLGRLAVQQIWLVHYANRTLNRIVGKTPYKLGQTRIVTIERWLQELGIS